MFTFKVIYQNGSEFALQAARYTTSRAGGTDMPDSFVVIMRDAENNMVDSVEVYASPPPGGACTVYVMNDAGKTIDKIGFVQVPV